MNGDEKKEKNLSSSRTADTKTLPYPSREASEAVRASVKNAIIRLDALKKPTLPDDLFDVYSFYSQQLL